MLVSAGAKTPVAQRFLSAFEPPAYDLTSRPGDPIVIDGSSSSPFVPEDRTKALSLVLESGAIATPSLAPDIIEFRELEDPDLPPATLIATFAELDKDRISGFGLRSKIVIPRVVAPAKIKFRPGSAIFWLDENDNDLQDFSESGFTLEGDYDLRGFSITDDGSGGVILSYQESRPVEPTPEPTPDPTADPIQDPMPVPVATQQPEKTPTKSRIRATAKLDRLSGTPSEDLFIFPGVQGNSTKRRLRFDAITGFESQDSIRIRNYKERVLGSADSSRISQVEGKVRALDIDAIDRVLGRGFRGKRIAAFEVRGFDGTFVALNAGRNVVDGGRPGFDRRDMLIFLEGYDLNAQGPIQLA